VFELLGALEADLRLLFVERRREDEEVVMVDERGVLRIAERRREIDMVTEFRKREEKGMKRRGCSEQSEGRQRRKSFFFLLSFSFLPVFAGCSGYSDKKACRYARQRGREG
jgi:hypothetical protein